MSQFIRAQVQIKLKELQENVALERGILRDSRRRWRSPEHDEQVRKFKSMEHTKFRIRNAEKAMADFIEEHRSFLGELPNGGRLCWDSFTGGYPIDTHYCELPEGHSGPHANAKGRWHREPKPPIIKPVIPVIREIMKENLLNLQRFGTNGKRSGPSIIMVRDTGYQQRLYRQYSCQKCEHAQINSYLEVHCAHPTFIREYTVAQYMSGRPPHYIVNWNACPALRIIGVDSDLTQPYPCPLIEQSPESKEVA